MTATAEEIFSICYVRRRWADAWVQVPLFVAMSASDQAAPGHAQATIVHDYGVLNWSDDIGIRAADVSPVVELKTSYVGWYVRIVTLHWSWYGKLVDRVDERDGDISFDGLGVVASGRETYTAYGLSFLLDQMAPIRGSIVYDHRQEDKEDRRQRIGKAIAFNGGWFGDDTRGNKFRWNDPPPVPPTVPPTVLVNFDLMFAGGADQVFHPDDITNGDGVESWTALAVVKYLLWWFGPADVNGVQHVPWAINAAALDYPVDPFSPEGMTIWQVLNQLLPRGRGIGLDVVVTNGPTVTGSGAALVVTENGVEVPTVNVWTHTPVDLPLQGSGTILPANTNQGSLLLSGFVNVTSEQVTESGLTVYDQVRVVGEYRGTVCTLAKEFIDPDVEGVKGLEIGDSKVWVANDGAAVLPCVKAGWRDAQVTEYNEGQSADPDYGDVGAGGKAERNALFRRQDSMRDVFAKWVINPEWNRQLPFDNELFDNGSNTITTINLVHVFPTQLPDGTLSSDGTYQHNPALVVADYLPMMADVDYSESSADFVGGIVDQSAVYGDLLAPQFWFDHRLAEHLDVDADLVDDDRQWNVQVRILQNEPGWEFRVAGGHQHFIAKDLYVPNGSYEQIAATDYAFDHNEWVATVYLISQERVQVVYPAPATIAAGIGYDQLNVFEVFKPDLFFDGILPGTIVGVEWIDPEPDNTDLDQRAVAYKRSAGGILRDDRAYMLDEAILIFQFVGQPRRILNLEYTASGVALPVGFLITSIGGGGADPVTINSVVTSVSINLQSGDVSVRTQADELDVKG